MAQPVLPTVTRVAAHRMLIPPNLSIKDEKHVYSLYNYRFCIFELNISLSFFTSPNRFHYFHFMWFRLYLLESSVHFTIYCNFLKCAIMLTSKYFALYKNICIFFKHRWDSTNTSKMYLIESYVDILDWLLFLFRNKYESGTGE